MDINRTKLISDSILGNGLAANIDISAGETIIGISDPFLILAEQAALARICSFCFDEFPSLKRCSSCKIPRYCSTVCQKSDWSSIHKQECPILKNMPAVPPTAVRGLMQVLLRHKHGASLDPVWKDLNGHADELARTGKRWEGIKVQAKGAVDFTKRGSGWVEMAVGLLCRMSTNAFRVTLPDDTPVGLCFSPTLALANHSCSPNALIIFNGRQVSLRSLSAIQSGEQIFISYVDPVQMREIRRAELKERYFFTCECVMCRQDENPYSLFLKLSPSLDTEGKEEIWWGSSALRKTGELCNSKLTAEFLTSSQSATTKIHALLYQVRNTTNQVTRSQLLQQIQGHLQPFTQKKLVAQPPYPSFLNEVYLYHLDTESYLPAFITLHFISLHCDPFTYPQPHHPPRVTHLYSLARLMKHIASLDTPTLLPPSLSLSEDERQTVRNVDYVSAVQAMLVLTRDLAVRGYGKENVFVKGIEAELAEVEEVQKMRGGVGLELKRWGKMGSVAVEGKLLAETLFGGLRDIGRMMGRVVEGLAV